MRILQINTFNFGSTGNIMLNISNSAKENGYISYVAYANSQSNNKKNVENSILIGNIIERNLHLRLAYYTGYNGCFSRLGTKIFLDKVDKIRPDIIHLHNLHNCYINLKMLFDYIKSKKIPVVWTLHDCWSFTGQCPHFTMVKCDKWKTGCYACPQFREYPESILDRTQEMYILKKKWFTGVEKLTIITPSQWLAGLVNDSFLSNYQVKVINNGIDLNIFQPKESDFREKHQINDKFIILGVASPWNERKGLATFIELSKRLDEHYIIVLIGLTDDQIKKLPHNILGLKRTSNAKELAEIYTAANVFVNPTLEDNFPTTNIEAIACGTPVLTFRTGGSAEIIDEKTGSVVECNDIDALEREVKRICKEKPYSEEACLNRAKSFDMNDRFNEYIALYINIAGDKDG